jgi:hypothetical protein
MLRDPMHPQGVGRWVPGCDAATLPLAVLRGVGSGKTRFAHEPSPKLRLHFLVYLCDTPWSLRSVRLVFGTPAAVFGRRFPLWSSARMVSCVT